MSNPNKRRFEGDYAQEFSIKKPAVTAEATKAGHMMTQPKIFEQPQLDNYGEPMNKPTTDFRKWSAEDIKEFLDQRGGDYDDCRSFEQLADRAQEVEINTGPAKPPEKKEEEEEYDPLDAFMVGINTEVKEKPNNPAPKAAPDALTRGLDEEYDALEFMEARSAAAAANAASAAASAAAGYDSDQEVYAAAKAAETVDQAAGHQYDSDDNLVVENKKGSGDYLPPVDHLLVEYEDFAKDFYEESPEVFAMDDSEAAALRGQMEMSVAGFMPPKPIKTFQQCGFDAQLMAAISKAGYERPTTIQCQALPTALSGRDVLGVAKTGSGKTAAFVLPMLVHIMDQRELDKGSGPIGLILAPTRELAEQIHKETRKFARAYSMRVSAAFGGLSKYEQVKDLKNGCEIAVATPGRMIDLIRMKACTLVRTTYLVLDEADRMFEMGFETQVRSILGQIRPDRQTLLFSATMPRKIQRLVTDALTNPVHITVGIEGVANRDVRQEAIICKDEAEKMNWLMAKLQILVDEGDVIVFASQRAKVDSLVSSLQAAGVRAAGIHGDMDQYSRMAVLDGFRAGQHHVLVATDVAARGLDIKTVKAVINFEAAKDIDTHIHRVGRTGRAGDKEGQAFSLLLPKDTQFASALVQSLALAGQAVSPELHELAMKDSGFRRGSSRGRGRGRGGGRGGGGRKPQVGGAGLGFGSSAGSGGGFTSAGKSFVSERSPQVLPPPPPAPQGGDASGAAAAAAASIAQRLASQGAGNSHQQQQQQLQQQAEGGRQFVANYHENRFRSSFVSSGTAGGSVGTGATVIAPKKAQTTASGAPLPPPPVPVTERPMYLQQQSFPAGRGGPRTQQSGGYGDRSFSSSYGGSSSRPQSFSNTSYHNAPPPPSVYGAGAPSASQQSPHQSAFQAGAAASAIEAAKAIAARLAAQGPGGGR